MEGDNDRFADGELVGPAVGVLKNHQDHSLKLHELQISHIRDNLRSWSTGKNKRQILNQRLFRTHSEGVIIGANVGVEEGPSLGLFVGSCVGALYKKLDLRLDDTCAYIDGVCVGINVGV